MCNLLSGLLRRYLNHILKLKGALIFMIEENNTLTFRTGFDDMTGFLDASLPPIRWRYIGF